MRVCVLAEIDGGYDGVQRLLLDLERFGYALVELRVARSPAEADAQIFDAEVMVAGAAHCETLGSRLARHHSVRSASVSPSAVPLVSVASDGPQLVGHAESADQVLGHAS